eukprot:CAMPEP_0198665572 /NCGR_PEP_ID=MMETSP1467-20131203/61009_1 /TAXON_ID=1462469 /ORGANISM="unid. sp., Strain CCMP2135" /LENGTH=340 /DNA_ID=CAMNT_0044402171 /DNA_START=40 /DNA_END=1062 /DNA_ORIENTATION=-
MRRRKGRRRRRPAAIVLLAAALLPVRARSMLNSLRVLRESGLCRYRLTVAYDGTNFAGWQNQVATRTVQGTLESVLSRRFDSRVATLGASRTDAGVHARGQVAQADLPEDIDCALVRHQLNRMLSDDVRVLKLERAPEPESWQRERDFPWHAIANAVGKRYIYKLSASREPMDPVQRLYRAQVAHHSIDVDAFREALALFVGTHDFRTFTNNARDNDRGAFSGNKTSVRTIHSIDFVDEGHGDATLTFELDGALYKMLRNIIGTSLAAAGVAHRRRANEPITLDTIPYFLQGELPRHHNPADAAPAHGLHLDTVYYRGDLTADDGVSMRSRFPPQDSEDD